MKFEKKNHPALSFWEVDTFFKKLDVIIIGSGIVGLNAAITLKEERPKWSVAVLEKGVLPSGASTRNAGFACFGSMTELLDDAKESGEEAMLALVEKRWLGLQRLRQRVGDQGLDYRDYGSYELFMENEEESFELCLEKRIQLNKQLCEVIGRSEVFSEKNSALSRLGFNKAKYLIYNSAEGQIDTGKMMQSLLQLAREKGVQLYNGCHVERVSEEGKGASVICENGWELKASKILICNNGFAKSLLPDLDVQPARNQVLITKPIPSLKIKGCFHYDSGYYYFRNVGDRVLLGGGRHLAKTEETTTQFQTTEKIKTALVELLQEVILPEQEVTVERWWSGILGVGKTKAPIVERISPSVFAAVRLGGMGIAIGSLTGEEGARLLLENK
ncbi:MAG: NAD(P)/FAD-dependent oxidoreductase [Saprospiraceae bacterium]